MQLNFNPGIIMETGAYFWRGRDKNGRRQDEIAKISDISLWAYHGIPIASYNHITHEYKRSNAGYETVTTKQRLNAIPAPGIFQKNFKWYTGDYKSGTEWQNENLDINLGGYHRIDAWRGYEAPAFAVAGASNTGGWSDSPCRPEDVQREFQELSAILRKNKIRSYEAWTETSNVFCIKNWLCVPGNLYLEARALIDPILESNFGRLAHKPE